MHRYLIADYERRNFSVSQCQWNNFHPPQIQSIISPKYATNTTATPSIESPPRTLSSTQKAGIIFGALIFASLLLFVLLKLYRRKQKKPPSDYDESLWKPSASISNRSNESSEICEAPGPVQVVVRSELEGSNRPELEATSKRYQELGTGTPGLELQGKQVLEVSPNSATVSSLTESPPLTR